MSHVETDYAPPCTVVIDFASGHSTEIHEVKNDIDLIVKSDDVTYVAKKSHICGVLVCKSDSNSAS